MNMISSIQLVWPWMLLLLPLPWLLYKLLPATNTQKDAALKVPYLQDFKLDHKTAQTSAQALSVWLYAFAWLALIIAAARPQYVGDVVELPVSGRDLMMAIDLSESMQTRDFILNGKALNRLQATKTVASEFIERRAGDRLGLILFAKQAYLQSPLTFDRTTINTFLQEAAIGLAGKATAIGDAIGLAIKRLRTADESDDNDKILVLLTDGENTAGELEPIKAAEIAARSGLKIYTIGIGAGRGMSSLGINLMSGMRTNLDETTLKAIAEKTGGQYFRAFNTQELEQIYLKLDKLEPIERDTKSYRPTRSLFHWPLALALALTLLLALKQTWTRFRP